MTALMDELDRTIVEWGDLAVASQLTAEFAARIAADAATMNELLDRPLADESLRVQCERHRLLDRLVVYDALDRGLRIRLHLSTQSHLDRPHDHRFSFTTRILCGSYTHVRHRMVGDLGAALDESVQEAGDAIPSDARFEPLLVSVEEAGSSYTLHHSEIHTTVTTPNTMSLFIRGPVEKERSLIADRETGRVWWRYGAHAESEERRRRKVMDRATVASMVQTARDLRAR